MATETRHLACKLCNAVTPHTAKRTSHVLHLLLSVFSLGLWLPIWLMVGASNASQKPRCEQCVAALRLYDAQQRKLGR